MNEEAFKKWIVTQISPKTFRPYESTTITSYITNGRAIYNKGFVDQSIFDMNDAAEFTALKDQLMRNPSFLAWDKDRRKSPSNFLSAYERFLSGEGNERRPIQNKTQREVEIMNDTEEEFSPNLIYFGAPGTGKSYTLNKNITKLITENNPTNYYERVTFHPDYSYANFVGTYKPTPLSDDTITYKYIPGPFMRIYKKAIQDLSHKYLLVIEEINRADVAAVFGDVFQLLDRNSENSSEYTVQASEDIKHYLTTDSQITDEQASTLSIPSNMYIWATMNSADQGVFPMDTAFKRRWDFKYMDIDEGQENIRLFDFRVGLNHTLINWNRLRKAINEELLSYGINEDKLMGPFFISKDKLTKSKFLPTFTNKVLMYLFDDAAKQKRNELFNGIEDINARKQFSKIIAEFNQRGVEIFNPNIASKFRISNQLADE